MGLLKCGLRLPSTVWLRDWGDSRHLICSVKWFTILVKFPCLETYAVISSISWDSWSLTLLNLYLRASCSSCISTNRAVAHAYLSFIPFSLTNTIWSTLSRLSITAVIMTSTPIHVSTAINLIAKSAFSLNVRQASYVLNNSTQYGSSSPHSILKSWQFGTVKNLSRSGFPSGVSTHSSKTND